MTIKLVRDGIPALIREQGREMRSVSVARGRTLLGFLQQKLVEEATEAYNAADEGALLAELADVSEVVAALLRSIGKSERDLADAMRAKRDERGAFDQGWVVDFQ